MTGSPQTASLAGRLLVAGPQLADPNFFRTVVLVLEHDHAGTFGLVLNRPSELLLDEVLPAWAGAAAAPEALFLGGPVSPETAFALGRFGVAGPAPAGVAPVLGELAVVALGDEPPPHEGLRDLRVFSGYAGWGPGQLEHELDEDAWLVVDARPDDGWCPEPERLWSLVLGRQRGALARLAAYPDEPRWN
jgi:putative transcriptional regulator